MLNCCIGLRNYFLFMCLYVSVLFLYFLEHYNENVEGDIDPDMIVVEMEKISVMFKR